MEFPDVGRNCHETSCKQLDFLPLTCDACSKIFCKDHIKYDAHRCSEAYKKDNQVPTCPLCEKPIPLKPGETADYKVSRHIDTDCQSDPAKERRGKIYTNKCSYKGCKQKELIPVSCEKCRQNYCLRHRHEQDHSCTGARGHGSAISRAGASALNRIQNSVAASKPKSTSPQATALSGLGRQLDSERRSRTSGVSDMRSLQSGMSDDEAMARAIQLSMANGSSTSQQQERPLSTQEQEDLALAQALAASEAEQNPRRRQNSQNSQKKDSSCSMS